MLLLFFVGVAESSAQVGEDYVSGDAQLSARFDGGRGTLWLAPHSEGRRVGESFVLRKGAALWAHPDSRATLTVGEKDLVLERGGLVALSLVDGEAVIELYVGRARPSSSAGIEVERGPWRWGQAAGAPGSVLETAVGASVFSPLVEDGKEAGVFGAVLYALDPSAALPARVEPSWMSLDIALSGVMAKLSMELRFELASSMRAQPLGLIELALPADALASAMSIEIEGQHIDARQAAGEAESSPSALIPPPSAGDGIQHVSIPLTLPSDGLVSMRVVWTMPMQLGGDTAALHLLPSSGSAAGQVERFELRVHGQGRGQLEQLWSMPPLQREGEQWTASLDDYPLANGVALAFAHQDETWAGRAEGVDGVFFAISHQPEVLDSSVGADVLFLLDLSASMAGVNLEHARGVITAAANNLNPQHDRVALLTYQSKAQVEMALTAADEAAVSQLEQTLAQAQAASTADVVNALRAASSYLLSTEREGRVVRLVLLSDRPLELSDDLEELLSMLAKDRLSLVELRLDEHTRSAEPLWAIPLLQVSAVTSPMLSAKQLIQAWDVALKPLLSYRATHDDVDALLWHRPKLCSGGPVFLLLGRHRVPQPFFDLPGRLELCLQDDEACDNPRVVELGQGGRSEMLASFYSVIADGAIPVALREELDEELGLLELRRELDWQLLDQAYSTAFHRYFYASPMRPWLDERYPSSGQRASMMDVPSASSARGEGSLPSSPKMRTDPYLRPSLEPSLPVPSISEVLLLARGGRKSTTSAASDPSSLDYTIQYYLAYSMENALSTARSAAAEALASDSQKYEAFLQAWHELGYRSNAQLYTLQSLYYAKNMYDKANLVSYDLQAMSDTSYSYGLDAQKSAIRFYLDQKLWRRAEPWLRKGLERYPSDRFFVDGMIRLLGAEGRQAELNALEIEVFSRELERNPGNGAVMDQLLVRLVDAKRSDIGRKALDSWQQRFGTSPTYYGLAAQLESLDGHPQKALTLLRTGVESFPRSRLARRLLVEALLGQGDVQAGVDSAREWLALD
ncbi:MAG: VWA domain-containing protein, partial [Myxococcota bacterium]|nr:VWA domain-containing protein [Myxococcota bacterium]